MQVKYTGKSLEKIKIDIQNAIKHIIPAKIKQIGLEHFDNSFARQGFEGGVYLPWQKLKQTKKNKGKAILIKSGRLRRSIKGKITPGKVIFSTDVPYAKIHNEGGTIQRNAMSRLYIQNRTKRGKNKGRFKRGTTSGRGYTTGAYTIKIPKRQFMGASSKLNRDIKEMIQTEILKATK
jgi:phage gpG-like protein